MSLSFQMLMKKAAAQTQSSAREAAELLAQREATERIVRKEQDERAAKEREARKAILLREIEVKKRAEEDETRKERNRERARQHEADREAQAIQLLRTGKIGAPVTSKTVTSLQQSSSENSRASSPRSGTYGTDKSTLSREEKRALANPLLRDSVVRPKAIAGKPKRRTALPGGAMSGPSRSPSSNNSQSNLSARQRINADFRTLTPLNTVKKDTRTIDEITRDLRRTRTGDEKVELTGYEATMFKDWFKSKKERDKEAAEKQETATAEAARRAQQSVSSSPLRPNTGQLSTGSSKLREMPSSSNSKYTKSPSSSPPKPFLSGNTASPTPSRPLGSTSKSRGATELVKAHVKRAAYEAEYDDESDSGSDLPDIDSVKRRKLGSGAAASSSRTSASKSKSKNTEFTYRPGLIASMMGRNVELDRAREADSDFESSDSDGGGRKGYGYHDYLKEEARSAAIARREDEEEEARLRKHEETKRAKKAQRDKEKGA